MERSSNFFVIHNYNTVPEELVSLCGGHVIFDASDDPAVRAELDARAARGGWNVRRVENTGHNITTYFSWIADEWDDLPPVAALLKGNLIGRHCSREYFGRVMHNTWFTYLYEEKQMRGRYAQPDSIACLASESKFIEDNTNWYMQTGTHPSRYFDSYDDLLRFVYVDPVLPRRVLFSPGACYIARAEQLRLHGPQFYRNMNTIMLHAAGPDFAAEAYLVERMLPVIWEERYEVQPWMEDEARFAEKLAEAERSLADRRAAAAASGSGAKARLRRLLGRG